MSFGKDIGQHYSTYKFNVFSDGQLYNNVSFEEIENGLTKQKRDVDLAILRVAQELLKHRCLENANCKYSGRATMAGFAVYGVNAMVELINDEDVAK